MTARPSPRSAIALACSILSPVGWMGSKVAVASVIGGPEARRKTARDDLARFLLKGKPLRRAVRRDIVPPFRRGGAAPFRKAGEGLFARRGRCGRMLRHGERAGDAATR